MSQNTSTNQDSVNASAFASAGRSLRRELDHLLSLDTCDSGSSQKQNPENDDILSELSCTRYPVQTLVIGGALGGSGGACKRDLLSWNPAEIQPQGWVVRFRLRVFTQEPNIRNMDTIRIFVGTSPTSFLRCIISLNQEDASTGEWKAKLNFFAFKTPPLHLQQSFLMVAVGEAKDNLVRAKLEIGRHIGTTMEDAGWEEKFVFWLPFWCLST